MVSMNKGKKKLSQRKKGQNSKRNVRLGVIALLVLCFVAIGLMAFINRLPSGSRYTYTTASDIWYLENAEMEIAAPEAGR